MRPFTFVVVTDSHLSGKAHPQDDLWWNRVLVSRAGEILGNAVKEINARGADFVVHCGDLTNDALDASFRLAGEILRTLDPPFYFAPGNHDTEEAGGRAAANDILAARGRPLYRVERAGGWKMILIDSAYWSLRDGSVADYRVPARFVNMAVPDVEMDWLRAELDADGATPTLCFMHPFPAVRDSYPAKRMAGPYSMEMVEGFRKGSLAATAGVTALLKRYRCVKAVFSGHGHWHENLVEHGTLFCQTGALAEYPCEMRIVRVSDDRLETEVMGIGGGFSEMSLVKETGNAWVAGRDLDRCITHVF
ncbi:MAG: metallophosphoesterase [Planctomycetota bacterium]